jgi:hypothetical protein
VLDAHVATNDRRALAGERQGSCAARAAARARDDAHLSRQPAWVLALARHAPRIVAPLPSVRILEPLVVTRASLSVMLGWDERRGATGCFAGKAVARPGTRTQSARRLMDGARAGRGGVLVVYGEAGVGKTALLDVKSRTQLGDRLG